MFRARGKVELRTWVRICFFPAPPPLPPGYTKMGGCFANLSKLELVVTSTSFSKPYLNAKECRRV